MKDYYQILGIDRSASDDDIKRAYRKMASKHHPDKGGDKVAFQDVQEAYDTLSDPNKRQFYDNPGIKINVGGPGFNFNDIFEMFGTRFEQPHVRRTQQARMTLWITLKDVAEGGSRIIAVGGRQGVSNVEIEIPPGIDDGDTVRYPGLGIDKSDLIITFRIRPDPKWQRQGSTLIVEYDIDFWGLILGTEIKVKSILDKELLLTIPLRTNPGTMLRVKGHGLTQKNSQGRGDMIVKVMARMPENIDDDIIMAIKKSLE